MCPVSDLYCIIKYRTCIYDTVVHTQLNSNNFITGYELKTA